MGKTTTVTAQAGGNNNVTQIVKSRAYVSKQHPIGDAKDPFKKSVINKELNDRLAGRTYPAQGDSSLCGPAAFFYCLLDDSPATYKRVVWDLWKRGKTQIGGLSINPREDSKRPKDMFKSNGKQKISGIDWMTLSSLRDSSNIIMDYDDINDPAAGITLPNEMVAWFQKAGYSKKFDFINSTKNNFGTANHHFLNNHFVVSLVSGAVVEKQPDKLIPLPTHWVVWSSTIKNSSGYEIGYTLQDINDNDYVKLTLFSWGKKQKPIKKLTYKEFLKHHFQTIVFSRN